MGWLTTFKPSNISAHDFVLHETGALNWSSDSTATRRVLRSAVINDFLYAAVEEIDTATGHREVWAAVIATQIWPGSRYENFGWKAMSELDCETAECPVEILDLLTPTTQLEALHWRLRCRTRVRGRRMPRIEINQAQEALF